METLKTCNGCFSDFNSKEHSPRVLPCGHSLCSHCLSGIVKMPRFRKCPFDGIAFGNHQDSLTSFPLNFLVMDLLEQRKANICEVHAGQKLKWLCLADKKKICAECVKDQEHAKHRIKKIRALKAHGLKVKEELQESLLRIEECEQEKNRDGEKTRKAFVHRVCETIRGLENVLAEKEFEWVQQVNNLFDAAKKNHFGSISPLKRQMRENIENITLTCEDDGDLALLDKEINQNTLRVKPEFFKERLTQMKNKAFEMQNALEKSLNTSKMTIKSLQLPSKDFIKEVLVPQEADSEEAFQLHNTLMTIKFKSYFDINNSFRDLGISTGSFLPKEIEVNPNDFEGIEKVFIQFKRYDLLGKEPQKGVVSYILNRLERFTSLDVSFTSDGFHKISLLWFGNMISHHLRDLRSFDLDLEKCKFNGEAMQFLCENVFCKMVNLQNFYLNCKSSKVSNDDLRNLAVSLKVFSPNLEFFALGLAGNKIYDSGINQVFEEIRRMKALKDLQLILSRTQINTLGLRIFAEDVLPQLESLDSLTLCLKKNRISDEGVLLILRVLPSLKHLKRLELFLSSTLVTDKTVEVLVEEVIPRLESLESLSFVAKKTQISRENLQRVWDVSEGLKEKKKQH